MLVAAGRILAAHAAAMLAAQLRGTLCCLGAPFWMLAADAAAMRLALPARTDRMLFAAVAIRIHVIAGRPTTVPTTQLLHALRSLITSRVLAAGATTMCLAAPHSSDGVLRATVWVLTFDHLILTKEGQSVANGTAANSSQKAKRCCPGWNSHERVSTVARGRGHLLSTRSQHRGDRYSQALGALSPPCL